MYEWVSNPLGGEKQQGKNCKSNLEAFGVEFFLGDRLLAPLRCGTAAEATNFPNHVKIEERSEKRKNHHWDADGVLVEAASGSVNTSGGGKSAEADGDAKAADGDDGRTGTLQEREDDARPAEDLWVEVHDVFLMRANSRLRDF